MTGLVLMRPALGRGEYATNRWACPWSGITFLLYAALSGVVFLARHGYPF